MYKCGVSNHQRFWSICVFRYNKLSTGAAATKTMLSDAGSRTATAAKNVGSATAKKLGEIRYENCWTVCCLCCAVRRFWSLFLFFFVWFVLWRGSSMFQSLETRVVSASSSIKVSNRFFVLGEIIINCYASSCTSGLSKVAGCRQKSPPTLLLSAGHSAWHFFTDGCLSSLLAAWNVVQEKWNFPSSEERGEVAEFVGYRGPVSKHH